MRKGFGSPQFCALRYQAISVFVVFSNFCSYRAGLSTKIGDSAWFKRRCIVFIVVVNASTAGRT